MKILNALAGATLSVAVMLVGTTTSFAAAAVSHPTTVASKAANDGTIVVAKRGRNAAIVGGIIAGAVGVAIIANEAAKAEERRARNRRRNRNRRYEQNHRPQPAQGGGYERCAYKFRSFRYSDGTYQPYGGGPRELCPYL